MPLQLSPHAIKLHIIALCAPYYSPEEAVREGEYFAEQTQKIYEEKKIFPQLIQMKKRYRRLRKACLLKALMQDTRPLRAQFIEQFKRYNIDEAHHDAILNVAMQVFEANIRQHEAMLGEIDQIYFHAQQDDYYDIAIPIFSEMNRFQTTDPVPCYEALDRFAEILKAYAKPIGQSFSAVNQAIDDDLDLFRPNIERGTYDLSPEMNWMLEAWQDYLTCHEQFIPYLKQCIEVAPKFDFNAPSMTPIQVADPSDRSQIEQLALERARVTCEKQRAEKAFINQSIQSALVAWPQVERRAWLDVSRFMKLLSYEELRQLIRPVLMTSVAKEVYGLLFTMSILDEENITREALSQYGRAVRAVLQRLLESGVTRERLLACPAPGDTMTVPKELRGLQQKASILRELMDLFGGVDAFIKTLECFKADSTCLLTISWYFSHDAERFEKLDDWLPEALTYADAIVAYLSFEKCLPALATIADRLRQKPAVLQLIRAKPLTPNTLPTYYQMSADEKKRVQSVFMLQRSYETLAPALRKLLDDYILSSHFDRDACLPFMARIQGLIECFNQHLDCVEAYVAAQEADAQCAKQQAENATLLERKAGPLQPEMLASMQKALVSSHSASLFNILLPKLNFTTLRSLQQTAACQKSALKPAIDARAKELETAFASCAASTPAPGKS